MEANYKFTYQQVSDLLNYQHEIIIFFRFHAKNLQVERLAGEQKHAVHQIEH